MTTVIERLEQKISELSELLALNSGGSWGSQRKEFLSKQIKNCEELIEAYRNTSAPLTLQEAEEKLNQQIGFDKEKKFILEWINIEPFAESHFHERKFPIFCFVGPPGTGKTSFAKIMAEVLGKPFFTLALGGENDPTILVGSKPESSRYRIGQISKFLIEGKKIRPSYFAWWNW